MSKSKGNLLYADDLVEKYGLDTIRYFVLHEIPFADDGIITEDSNARYNLQEASKAGIRLGVYFFSAAVTEEEAREEAAWVAELVAGYPILMVLRNLHRIPGLYSKLCHYAKHTDQYPETEKWQPY